MSVVLGHYILESFVLQEYITNVHAITHMLPLTLVQQTVIDHLLNARCGETMEAKQMSLQPNVLVGEANININLFIIENVMEK